MADSLTRAQVRGARAMLDWSMTDLARAAGLSVSSVKRAEDDRLTPVADATAITIRGALETSGIRFLPDDGSGPGLQMKP